MPPKGKTNIVQSVHAAKCTCISAHDPIGTRVHSNLNANCDINRCTCENEPGAGHVRQVDITCPVHNRIPCTCKGFPGDKPSLDCGIHGDEHGRQQASMMASFANMHAVPDGQPEYPRPVAPSDSAIPSSGPQFNPVADIKAIYDRVHSSKGQQAQAAIANVMHENARQKTKAAHAEREKALETMGAVYAIDPVTGAGEHVGWVAADGSTEAVGGGTFKIKTGVGYKTMCPAGPSQAGTRPVAWVSGIHYQKQGFSPGTTFALLTPTGVTAPMLTQPMSGPGGVTVPSGFNYPAGTINVPSPQIVQSGFAAVNSYKPGDNENSNPEDFKVEWFAQRWNSREDITLDADEYPDEVGHFWFEWIWLPGDAESDLNHGLPAPVNCWFHANMSYKAAEFLNLALTFVATRVSRKIEVWDVENDRSEWVVV